MLHGVKLGPSAERRLPTDTFPRKGRHRARRVCLAGTLVVRGKNDQVIELLLDTGDEVRGVLTEKSMPKIRDLRGYRVVVFGRAIFRPSGRLLRIDIEQMEPGSGFSSFWSRKPRPHGSQRHATLPGVLQFFGTWPGDETEEQLLTALSALRSL